jgi:hypothetical protein
MNWRRWIPAPWLRAVQGAAARIDAMPDRDRLALVGGLLALVAAVEWMVVWPLHAKRDTIVAAAVQQAQQEADAASELAQAAAQRQSELESRLAQVSAELARMGAGNVTGQSLNSLLSQTLAGQGAQIVSLRELAVEDVQPAGAEAGGVDNSAATANAAADAASAAAGAAAASTALFRHRFELTLAGNHDALISALGALDRSARPLRIERVRVATVDGAALQARITLAVIGTEKSWLVI